MLVLYTIKFSSTGLHSRKTQRGGAMLRGRDYPHNAGAALYSILYRNSLCNGHYSTAACPRVHCRALQHYSTLQHTTALQLYSVYTLQHSAPPLCGNNPNHKGRQCGLVGATRANVCVRTDTWLSRGGSSIAINSRGRGRLKKHDGNASKREMRAR